MSEPSEGHTFRISVESRGSYRVTGDPTYRDAPEFDGIPWVMEVRAWSLREALEKAVAVPFATWAENTFGSDDEVCSCGNRFDGDNLCMKSACQMET